MVAVTRKKERAASSLSWSTCCRTPSSGHVLGTEVVLTPFAARVEASPEGGQGSAGSRGTPGAGRFGVLMSPALSHVPPPDV